VVARSLAAALAFYATTKQPYNFYIFTRWMVFLTCGWGLWLCWKRLWPSFAPGYFVVGLLFNPFSPFHFQRSTWHNLDIAAGVILLISMAFHRNSNHSSGK
jgi:hypothetical protein